MAGKKIYWLPGRHSHRKVAAPFAFYHLITVAPGSDDPADHGVVLGGILRSGLGRADDRGKCDDNDGGGSTAHGKYGCSLTAVPTLAVPERGR